MAQANTGRVVQVIGPVVDVEFDKDIPPIYQALHITAEGESPIDGDAASWFLSLLVHLGLLVALGVWFQSAPRRPPR